MNVFSVIKNSLLPETIFGNKIFRKTGEDYLLVQEGSNATSKTEVFSDYLKLDNLGEGMCELRAYPGSLECSSDKKVWFKLPQRINFIHTIYLRGKYQAGCRYSIACSNHFSVSGNLISLVLDAPYTFYDFSRLFENNENLILAKDLRLPTFDLRMVDYSGMFSYCTNLEEGPEINGYYVPLNYPVFKDFYNSCYKLKKVIYNLNDWNKNLTPRWLKNAGINATEEPIFMAPNIDDSVLNSMNIPDNWVRTTKN